MKVEEKRILRERWTPEAARAGNLLIGGGQTQPPFGTTEAGAVDLRGLEVDARRLAGLALRELDLTAARTRGVVFFDCQLEDCSFEFADWPWSDYKSSFRRCRFRGAILHPGGFGRSNFVECDFGKSDLSGLSCNRPRFEYCSFEEAKMHGSEMGGSLFESCKFDGMVKNCTFSGTGGGFLRCDLRRAVFMECDFKMMRLENCMLAAEHLWYDDWPAALSRLETALGEVPTDIAPLLSTWRQQANWHPTQLIDIRHIRKKYPPGAAAALETALRSALM